MNAVVDKLNRLALRLPFAHLWLLIIAVAVISAETLAHLIWRALYGSPPAEVVTVTLATTFLVSIPLVGFLVSGLRQLKDMNRTLARTMAELDSKVFDLQRKQVELNQQRQQVEAALSSLTLARDRAEAANRAKSEFLANMSHELRTPLNAVIGFSEIMMQETFGPLGSATYKEYAQDIHASGGHLLAIINDILDLSKIEAGRLEVEEQPVDLQHTIEAAVRMVADRARKQQVEIQLNLPPALPAFRGSPRMLQQILLNLLSNAVKFTPSLGRVELAARLDGGDLMIRISDTGIGMEERDIDIAMTAFGQVDSALNRRYEGTGLGLPLAKAMTELHDGTLTLTSRPAAGTVVTLRFPAPRLL